MRPDRQGLTPSIHVGPQQVRPALARVVGLDTVAEQEMLLARKPIKRWDQPHQELEVCLQNRAGLSLGAFGHTPETTAASITMSALRVEG
jgi:hypothetical protein